MGREVLGMHGVRASEDDDRAAGARPPTGLLERIRGWARFTTGAFAVLAAVLVVLLVLNERVFEPRVRRAIEASRVVRLTNEAMLDQETSLRAFLVSGDERFLTTYDRGSIVLPGLHEQAGELLAGDRVTNGLLLDMRVADEAWHNGWVDDALAAGRSEDANKEALLVEGKGIFDRYRIAYTALTEELAQRRQAALDAQSTSVRATAGVGLGLTLVMALDSLRRNRRLRRSVEPPLAAILDHLDRIARGDFATGEALAGPAELVQIDAGLDATALALDRARAEAEEQSTRTLVQNRQLGQVLRLAREIAGSSTCATCCAACAARPRASPRTAGSSCGCAPRRRRPSPPMPIRAVPASSRSASIPSRSARARWVGRHASGASRATGGTRSRRSATTTARRSPCRWSWAQR